MQGVVRRGGRFALVKPQPASAAPPEFKVTCVPDSENLLHEMGRGGDRDITQRWHARHVRVLLPGPNGYQNVFYELAYNIGCHLRHPLFTEFCNVIRNLQDRQTTTLGDFG